MAGLHHWLCDMFLSSVRQALGACAFCCGRKDDTFLLYTSRQQHASQEFLLSCHSCKLCKVSNCKISRSGTGLLRRHNRRAHAQPMPATWSRVMGTIAAILLSAKPASTLLHSQPHFLYLFYLSSLLELTFLFLFFPRPLTPGMPFWPAASCPCPAPACLLGLSTTSSEVPCALPKEAGFLL